MKYFPTSAAITLLLSLLTVPTQAATMTWWRNEAPNSYGIKITGRIVKDDVDQFKRMLLAADPNYLSSRVAVTVHLDTPGGLMVAAIGIGNTIRLYGFNTFVPDGAQCASACGLIWLAGTRRFVSSVNKVGFHTPYDPKTRKSSPSAISMVRGYLSAMEISKSTIDYLLQAPAEGMEWLSPEQSRQRGIEVWVCAGDRCTGELPVPQTPQTALSRPVPVVPQVMLPAPMPGLPQPIFGLVPATRIEPAPLNRP